MVIVCEHASARLPPWLKATPPDLPLLYTHWALDIGVRGLAEALVARSSSVAVCAEFSRLVCDANRAVEDPSFIVSEVQGHRLSFNRQIDSVERRRREALHAAYHQKIDETIDRRKALGGDFLLLALHSFTPIFAGAKRDFAAGVLFDENAEDWVGPVAAGLSARGLSARLNEPYSGRDGLIYSVWRHGRLHDLPYFEIEIRQDFLGDDQQIASVADKVLESLSYLL